jgi:hypothetical protein
VVDNVTETQGIPKGYQEVKSSGKEIKITRDDMPWLPVDMESKNVSLVKIRLEDGTEFYLGSAVAHGTLQKEAEKLGKQGAKKADDIFYRQIRAFMQKRQNPDVPKVQHPRSKESIFYAKSGSGERVYFMELDNVDGNRVILRVAACDKNSQSKILHIIAKH